MFTPANSIRQISFWTLAGVEKADVNGEEIVGRFANEPKPFSGSKSQRLFEEYANWPNDLQGVLRFTKRYGPLEQSARPNGDFRFRLRDWHFQQDSFRKEWEHLMPRPHVRAEYGLYSGVAGDRRWDFDSRTGLRYRAANFWEYLRLSLMACPRERLRKCSRPECPNPYFVARHLKQNYCSQQCSRWAQQKWKKRWWHEHGKKQRHRKQHSSRKGK